jgi:hypothetical protein
MFSVLLLVVGSWMASAAKLEPVDFASVPPAAVKEINVADFEASKLTLDKQTFFILSRKVGGLGRDRFAKAIELAWPEWQKLFAFNVHPISFLDFDQFIGGGPFSEGVLGVYSSSSIPIDIGHYVDLILGWGVESSTRAA